MTAGVELGGLKVAVLMKVAMMAIVVKVPVVEVAVVGRVVFFITRKIFLDSQVKKSISKTMFREFFLFMKKKLVP